MRRHGPTAYVHVAAERALREEAARATEEETGGLLLGYWSGAEVVIVTGVIGPGPKASHGERSFHPDHEWQQAELARRYTESGQRQTYLGDWHTHPGGTPRPSRTDRSTLRRVSKHGPARAPRALLALLAPGPDGDIVIWRRIGVAAVQRVRWTSFG